MEEPNQSTDFQPGQETRVDKPAVAHKVLQPTAEILSDTTKSEASTVNGLPKHAPSSIYPEARTGVLAKPPATNNSGAGSSFESRGVFSRRIGRLGFILGFIYLILTPAPILFFIILINNKIINTVFIIAYIVVMIFLIITLYVRRLHDLNRPGIWLLLHFVPIVNIALLIYVLFAEGNPEENDYGSPVSTTNYWVVIGLKRPKILKAVSS
jgi:uncharacterized membrane protein YhaH (DUF805 family)